MCAVIFSRENFARDDGTGNVDELDMRDDDMDCSAMPACGTMEFVISFHA